MKKALFYMSVSLMVLLMPTFLSLGTSGLFSCSIEQITYDTQDDWRPSLCVDASGRPHIAWIRWQVPFEIYYAVKDSSQWKIIKVKTFDSTVFHSAVSLSLDSDERPHIAYLSESSRWDLWYAYWNETSMTWSEEHVADGGSDSHFNTLNLAVDSTTTPHIAWSSRWGGLFGVFHATKTAGAWNIETISHDDDAGPSLFVDNNDVPHVLWWNERYLPNLELRYAARTDGTWATEAVTIRHFGNGERQILIDSSGVPHVTFSNKNHATGFFEVWYANRSGGMWSFKSLELTLPAAQDPYPSIALDPQGAVHLVWKHYINGVYNVHLACLHEGNWLVKQVSDGDVDEYFPSFAIDPMGRIHIAWNTLYFGSGQSEIYYAKAYYCIGATADIAPDTLNVKSEGRWITAYIEFPQGYDVNNIDVSTVLLNGTIPAETQPTGIGDKDTDGIPDLMLKFSRAEVIQYVLDNVAFAAPEKSKPLTYAVDLTITGSLYDGTTLEGTNTIRILYFLKNHPEPK